MKTSIKLFMLSTLVLLWFWAININQSFVSAAPWWTPGGGWSSTSNLTNCDWFWANFEDCWVSDIKWIAWTASADTTWDSLLTTIKKFINRALWILSLITLVLLLRWWFQMVTAAWDDAKYKVWFKILKQAAMWLVFIWVSRLIVSMIFWIISLVTTP